jgi:hypothetical protein
MFFVVKGCTTSPDHRVIGNSRYGNLLTFSDQYSCGVAAFQGAARGERRHDGEAGEAVHLSTESGGDFRSERVDQKVSIGVEPQVLDILLQDRMKKLYPKPNEGNEEQ